MQHWTNAELFEHFEDLERAQECVKSELRKRNLSWQHLAHAGLFAMACTAYREKYKVELREAFDAVRAFNKEVAGS